MGAAVVVLAGVVGTAGWTATRQVAAIDTQKQPTSGAWMGSGVTGPVGVPLRESAFEFTVYRMSCGAPGTAAKTDGGGAAPANGRRCEATVGCAQRHPETTSPGTASCNGRTCPAGAG